MSQAPDARSLALSALHAMRRREAFADAVLDGVLGRHPELDARGRGLTSHLVYGVLRWQNRLDAHLARASSRPLEKTHPLLLDILRLGAYQLLFLDRVPDRAAVSESVELARRSGHAHASGFVNAVLRKVAAQGPDLTLPADPAMRLSLLFGCPVWLVEVWRREHGEVGAERLCRAASVIPTLTVRIDLAAASRADVLAELGAEGVTAGAGRWAPEAVWVEGAGDPRALGVVARGGAVVQDQASQLIAHWVAPQPGWSVLDACAAPGLKATHLARLTGEGSRIVALDVHPHRVRMIEELSRRLGIGNVEVRCADAREYRPDDGRLFDAVLVDAPCSGLGVLSRTPDAKWRRSPEEAAALPALQLALLRNLADAVRPGGILVYATCTTLRAENEDLVAAFLAERPDFHRTPPPPGPVAWAAVTSAEGDLRTYPDHVGEAGGEALDGFFGARLARSHE
ncbi:MAG: 16S rRNA (cytosine(967)-C(5))-methyltransferase RsmB [Deltaproteobacteria bacterium]|nr:16S rRNA (cytosine(967)-C(5))-methyltransferase RsmB [Deltaproteobacteria bacterium]